MSNPATNALPFRIKICGVTTIDDATSAIGCRAEAIGLNFYRRSKRFVPLDTASEIALVHSTSVPIVAVTVNSTLEDIRELHDAVDFAWIQLHGDETPELVGQLKTELGLPIIRAFRWQQESDREIAEYLERCAALNSLPEAMLIDAYKPGEFGGTGDTADWNAIARWREKSAIELPLILAGGLCAANVAEAIACVRPDAVDTASGVESSPGRKDVKLVADFANAARQAFSKL